MEGDPGADAWTTVEKKLPKKKTTRDGSKDQRGADGGRGQGQAPGDRKKKDSIGARQDNRGGDRRQPDRDRRQDRGGPSQGDRGGGRRPPSGRGGSTSRNTLPRKPRDGTGTRGGGTGSHGNGAERKPSSGPMNNAWETWTPAPTTVTPTSTISVPASTAVTNSPRKQSWASLVDRGSTPATRESSATPAPIETSSATPALIETSSAPAPIETCSATPAPSETSSSIQISTVDIKSTTPPPASISSHPKEVSPPPLTQEIEKSADALIKPDKEISPEVVSVPNVVSSKNHIDESSHDQGKIDSSTTLQAKPVTTSSITSSSSEKIDTTTTTSTIKISSNLNVAAKEFSPSKPTSIGLNVSAPSFVPSFQGVKISTPEVAYTEKEDTNLNTIEVIKKTETTGVETTMGDDITACTSDTSVKSQLDSGSKLDLVDDSKTEEKECSDMPTPPPISINQDEQVGLAETEKDANVNSNSSKLDNADIPAESNECDNSNANSTSDVKPVEGTNAESSELTAPAVSAEISKEPSIETCTHTQDSTVDNDKSYESLDNETSNGLQMNIDKNIKDDSLDANGNNVSLDSNKNKMAKSMTPEMEELLKIPVDPETRQYDRDILLKLQKHPLSLKKPKLPELEIVLNVPLRSSASAPLLGDKPIKDFVRPGLPMKRDSRRKEPKKVISISREPVKLRGASENAWKPKASKEGDEIEVLGKKVTAILNKITPQKFQTLVVQFKELEIDTEEKLVLTMQLVFEKAVEEPAYSKVYADLVTELSKKHVYEDGKLVDFRGLLLRRCQHEFQKEYISPEEKTKYAEDLKNAETEEDRLRIKNDFEQMEAKMRKRSLGNIRFVGEMYLQGLILMRIMHEIIKKLLTKEIDEESMECLCRFLTTCGGKLEKDGNALPEKMREMASLDKYFTKIKSIITERKTSSRVRFMLQDVVELKANRWVTTRRKETGPKTIDEVHKEAKMEELKIQLADSQNGPPVARRSEEKNRRKTEYRPKPVSSVEEGGWNNVPTKAAKMSLEMDTEKLRGIGRKVDADTLTLGGGFRSWGMGSSTAKKSGGGNSASSSASKAIGGNRFLLLEDSEQPATAAPLASSGSHLYAGRASEPVIRSYDRSSSRASSSLEKGRTQHDLDSSRESSIDRSMSILRGSKDADPETVRSKFKTILQEYLSNCDFQETLNSVCELFSQSNIELLVDETVCLGLERINLMDRTACGRLMVDLSKKDVLTTDTISSGLASVLEIAEDMIIDIPKFWSLLADILVITILELDCFNTLVKSCCSYIPDVKLKQKFVSCLLIAIQSKDGDKLSNHLEENKEMLEQELSQDITTFLQDKGIVVQSVNTNEETNPTNATSAVAVSTTDSSCETPTKYVNGNLQETLARQLTNLLEKRLTGNPELDAVGRILCDKKLDNETVRTLVYTVIESVVEGAQGETCTLNKELLMERLPILKKYIDADKERELYAMYALQNLVNKLEHPHKLLHNILEILYDNEVISDEGIFEWEGSKDVEEQEGKGVAVAGCNQFLEWLHSAEEEDEETEVDKKQIA